MNRGGWALALLARRSHAGFAGPVGSHLAAHGLDCAVPSVQLHATPSILLSQHPPSSCNSSNPHLQLRTFFSGFSKPQSKKHQQRRLVGWSPEQLYSVVADVDQYFNFVPWCRRSVVTKRSDDGSYMEADLEVGFQLLVEKYKSQVVAKPPRQVQSTVQDSMLFHHLTSSWTMDPGPAPNTCWLTFHVDFAFNNSLYANLADVFFSEVVQRMVGAFEGRCKTLYGPSALVRVRLPPTTDTQRPAQATESHQHQVKTKPERRQ